MAIVARSAGRATIARPEDRRAADKRYCSHGWRGRHSPAMPAGRPLHRPTIYHTSAWRVDRMTADLRTIQNNSELPPGLAGSAVAWCTVWPRLPA